MANIRTLAGVDRSCSKQSEFRFAIWHKASCIILFAVSVVGCSGDDEAAQAGGSGGTSGSTAGGGYSGSDTDPYAGGRGGYGGNGGYGDTNTEEPAATLPEDVSQWKPADYDAAKTSNDTKLSQAVQHLDQPQFRDNAEVAKVLAKLLTVKEAPQTAAAQNDGYGGGYAGAGGGRGGYGAQSGAEQIDETLAREVVAALGRNTSGMATTAIHMLVQGEVKTPLDPQSMFTEALHAMVDNPRPSHHEIIFKLATKPGDIIKEAEAAQDSATQSGGYAGGGYAGGGGFGGELTVQWVREEMLRELQQWADPALRMRLAQHLQDPTVTQETFDEFEQLLISDDPRNLAAQIVMYQIKDTSEQTRDQLEERLARGSQQALAHLMNIPFESNFSGYGGGYGSGYPGSGYGGSGSGGYPGAGRGTGYDGGIGPPPGRNRIIRAPIGGRFFGQRPSRDGESGRPSRGGGGYDDGYGNAYGNTGDSQLDPAESLAQLTELLWAPAIADQLGALAMDMRDLGERPNLLRLLASMPVPEARQRISNLLVEHSADGPRVFASAGLFGQDVVDPYFLIAAKAAHREADNNNGGRRNTTPRRGAASDGYGYAGGGGAADAPGDAWNQEIENLVQALNSRFMDADSTWATEEQTAESGDSAADDPFGPLAAMPVTVHRGAEIVAEYHARWPDDSIATLPTAEVAPLQIHYVRIEEENRPGRIATMYQRQAGRNSLTHEEDGGGRIDGFVNDKTTGMQQSIDVRIYNDPNSFGNAAELRANDPRNIVIEILTITRPDG